MIKRLMVCLGLLLAAPINASTADVDRLRSVLQQLTPGQNPDSIVPAPFPGFFEVLYGPQLFYVSADGRYLLSGEVIDLKDRSNVSEKRRAGARLRVLDALGEESMIIFAPKGESKHTVTVFTDIDCGYCRKLHHGMKEMNELGIRVRYLAYPRAGVGSPSYQKAVSVWCAKDRQQAITVAKSGTELESRNCDHPVQRHMAVADQFNVQGTPALVLDDGRLLPGYVPPKQLLKILEGGDVR